MVNGGDRSAAEVARLFRVHRSRYSENQRPSIFLIFVVHFFLPQRGAGQDSTADVMVCLGLEKLRRVD
jgi:hypothetical protein